MGRKHNVSVDMLAAGSGATGTDMSTTITSRVLDTAEMDKASLHLTWAAGPVGTLRVFVRNNPKDPFYALDFGATQTLTSADSDIQVVFTEMPFVNLYFVYTPTSGSGTLTAFANVKSVGA